MADQAKTTIRRRTKAPPASTAAAIAPQMATQAGPDASGPKGKLGSVIALLRRPGGAGITELMATTGWQAHSVRGAISGALKKKLGLTVLSEKTEAGRTYRIVAADVGPCA